MPISLKKARAAYKEYKTGTIDRISSTMNGSLDDKPVTVMDSEDNFEDFYTKITTDFKNDVPSDIKINGKDKIKSEYAVDDTPEIDPTRVDGPEKAEVNPYIKKSKKEIDVDGPKDDSVDDVMSKEDSVGFDDKFGYGDEKENHTEALATFIKHFNHMNNNTPFFLAPYTPDDKFYRSFTVCMEVTNSMIYFDREKYETGMTHLELNDAFYADLRRVAKDNGISRISWDANEDTKYGSIEL